MAYASFTNSDSATAAVEALNERQCELLNKRVLKACYAKLVTEEEHLILNTLVECTSETKDIVIPGVYVLNDFVSEEEEKSLIHNIDNEEYVPQLHRRVQHYGYRFDYKSKDILKDISLGELPVMFNSLLAQVEEKKVLKYGRPDQITVNEYEPGIVCVLYILYLYNCISTLT